MFRELAAMSIGAVVAAAGQTAMPPTAYEPRLQQLLARVVANVAEEHAALPSITADEEITSSLMQHGLYRAHGTAKASLRVSHGAPGEQLNEVRTYLVLDGKSVPPGKKAIVPFQLNGAFSRVADTFFAPEHVPCYTFTLLPAPAPDGSVQLAFVTAAPLPASCPNRDTLITGFARVDAATAHIRYIERSIPAAGEGHHTTFLAIDYAPSAIGGQSIWLPSFLSAELDYGKGTFSARYSNFHRYTGTVTLLPDVTPVEPATPSSIESPPAPPPQD